ncbi:hypothetical protein [Enterococcus sp. S86.2]|uniref:hypothetical protein n=1 Tax=Enterococcus sp. S86.2 TaxID=3031299 RepID=UPI0026ECBF13|nr:hypothetical protein [Enterococcus sp. S86.2]
MKHKRHIAKSVDNWTRIEAEYSGIYAHRLTEEIQKCKSDEDLKNLLLNSILDKYMFFYTKSNKPHLITKLMLEALNDKNFQFNTPSSRNNLLEQSIDHLVKGSGLLPTLYKIDQIWGSHASEDLLIYLYKQYYENFIPNQDHISWVNKYKPYYLLEGKPWKKN